MPLAFKAGDSVGCVTRLTFYLTLVFDFIKLYLFEIKLKNIIFSPHIAREMLSLEEWYHSQKDINP